MIEFTVENTHTDCRYIYDSSCITFSIYQHIHIWFNPSKENGYGTKYKIDNPLKFSEFAEKANEWLVYQILSENQPWDENGFLIYSFENAEFVDGKWCLFFTDHHYPSFSYTDANSTLTFHIDYNTLPLFLEWASNLKDFL